MDTPKLLNVPSAYKAGKMYSPIPTDGGGDLAFTRASAGTRINSNGVIEEMGTNVPRLDYSGGGCPSWLFEPQRTNLLTYSEQFDNAAWIKSNATISGDASIAPDGFNTADLFLEDLNDSSHFVTQTGLTIPTAISTFSIYVKQAVGSRYITLGTNGGGVTNVWICVDLSNGSVTDFGAGTFTYKVTAEVDGWYRLILTVDNTSLGLTGILLGLSDSDSPSDRVPIYQGDGTSGVYLWGAQLERGGYPTSYIKTEAQTVTRSADATAAKDVSSYVTPTNGAIMADVESIVGKRDGGSINIQIGTTNGRVFIYDGLNIPTGYLTLRVQFPDGTFNDVQISKRSKVLFNWSATNVDIWVDGVKQVSAGKAFSLTNTNLSISGANSKLFNLYNLALWDATLTDSEAQQITT